MVCQVCSLYKDNNVDTFHDQSNLAMVCHFLISESEQEQSPCVAAATMLRSVGSWRYFTRNYEGLRAFCLSLIAGCVHTGVEGQGSLTVATFMLALRSMRPPRKSGPSSADEICFDCISIASPVKEDGSACVPLSGRQATIISSIPLYILPDISAAVAPDLVKHYMRDLLSDHVACRKLGATAIPVILLPKRKPNLYQNLGSETSPKMSCEAVEAAEIALKNELETNGVDFLNQLTKKFAYSHHAMASGGDESQSSRSMLSSLSRDDAVVNAIITTVVRGLEWPSPNHGIKAISAGHFYPRQARIVEIFTQASPEVVPKALKEVVCDVIGKSQDSDRPMVAAVAEILAGMIASGTVFDTSDDGTSYWESWIGPTLARALDNTPLDLLDMWSDCVLRFSVHGLMASGREDALDLLVDAAIPRSMIGGSSSDVCKKVTYMTSILNEMIQQDSQSHQPRSTGVSVPLKHLLWICIEQLPALAHDWSDSDMARQAIAGLAADVSLIILGRRANAVDKDLEKLVAAIERIHDTLAEVFNQATEYLFNQNKDKVLEEDDSGMDVDRCAEDENEASETYQTNGVSNASISLSRVAFSCELTYQLLASTCSKATPWILRVLTNIMRVIELIPSEAQFVGSTVRLAMRSVKYQPFDVHQVQLCLQAVLKSSSGSLWTERAAALVFLQYFWFRHALILGDRGSETVMNEALRLINDSKLEVRELGSATVSGVIRALSPEKQEKYRILALEKARTLFPERKRRRVDTSDKQKHGSGLIPERHGAALFLKALVLATPYDVPEWLPDILMALVRLASEPAPVKSTVTEALADFRRTHEEGGLMEMKEVLTPDQWEAIRDVATPASYFV